ncbi:MAG: septum formation initiator family protein [Spirochaetales bacterium]
MNTFHLLLATCCGVLVYVCISVLGGQEGIWAYNQLQNHKIVLAQHLTELQQINEQLNIDSNALKYDNDVLIAYAKKMGFIHEGEVLVKISGFADSPAFVYNTGVKILRPKIIYIPDELAKCIGFIVFVSYNLIASLIAFKKSLRTNDSVKA